MKIDNFFAELKRRNVYKVAVAYAVVAWLLIQSGLDLVPDLRRACLGHESFRHHYRPLFPRRAGLFLGFRDHAGRYQTGIGYRPGQIAVPREPVEESLA